MPVHTIVAAAEAGIGVLLLVWTVKLRNAIGQPQELPAARTVHLRHAIKRLAALATNPQEEP
jgi:hypothetical protein